MHSKTRIVVLHMKEVIYTGIFLLLGILFLIVLIFMFKNDKSEDENSKEHTAYIPGVYTTSLRLGENTVELEMVLDKDNINSIRLVNMSESVTTMYPLVQPVFDQLSNQICEKQSLENISISDENRYTSTVLLKAIQTTLNKAKASASMKSDIADPMTVN